MSYIPSPNFEITMVGSILSKVDTTTFTDRIEFETNDGRTFILYHTQDCCESVRVESIKGDVADLIGVPILAAAESINHQEDPEDIAAQYGKIPYRESFTWTTFILVTEKGTVILRWLGESNGYYSESVSFEEMTLPKY